MGKQNLLWSWKEFEEAMYGFPTPSLPRPYEFSVYQYIQN